MRAQLLTLVMLGACYQSAEKKIEPDCACDARVPEGGTIRTDGGPLDGATPVCTPAPKLQRAFKTETFDGCVLASLLEYQSKAGPLVIAASGEGRVHALDPVTGETKWSVAMPAREGELAYIVATPALLPDGKLVVAWQDIESSTGNASAPRTSQRLAVVDLEQGKIDESFPIVSLAAEKPNADGDSTVVFSPNNALSRARLVHVAGAKGSRGLVYIGLGNARDIQPWHGWMFELDLDAWHDSGAAEAVSSVLLTSPESDCGKAGVSGSRDMICGAGIWAPAGPEVVNTEDGSFDLFIPTGNGALDLARRDYAHTLMRVRGTGLNFDPGCDVDACKDWNALTPSDACMSSCKDLFIPRLKQGDPPLAAPQCDGLSFFECYAKLDWDLGANAPAVVDVPGGPRTLLLPAKDGAVYLIDYDHLGNMLDRLPIVEPCGAGGAKCSASWPGMMVTRPELTMLDGTPLAVISTFNFDDTHPAGLVGVKVVMRDGKPRLEKVWSAPAFDTSDAVAGFRKHPSRVRLLKFDGIEYATVVDQVGPSGKGELYLVRVSDGAVVRKVLLDGPGQRFAQPLWSGSTLYVTSCVNGNAGPSHIEAWTASAACP